MLQWLKQSDLGDRATLIQITENASIWFGPDALINVGDWGLQVEDSKLTLRARLSAGPAGSIAYVAPVANDGSVWIVREVRPMYIHARR